MSVDYKDNETSIPVNQSHRHHMDSGSDSAFIGSWGSSSSSSFLTTSLGSELDSNDADLDDGADSNDDDQFIAQLTRKMADYMLEEDDGSGGDENPPSEDSGLQKPNFQTTRSYADAVKKSIVGFQSNQSFTGDTQIQPNIQLYQVENQPRAGVRGWGSRGKTSKSTQHVKLNRHEQTHSNRGVRGSKELVNGGKGYVSSTAGGSGMRAIFLGGSGSRKVMGGTGVFLPRSATDATDQGRKKRGCSTVLVPTRVLQALQHHFNNVNMDSLSLPKGLAQTPSNHQVKEDRVQAQESVSSVDSKLPQEWIY